MYLIDQGCNFIEGLRDIKESKGFKSVNDDNERSKDIKWTLGQRKGAGSMDIQVLVGFRVCWNWVTRVRQKGKDICKMLEIAMKEGLYFIVFESLN